MKTNLVYLLAGALALGFTTISQAEDKPEHRPEGRRSVGFSLEERQKFAKAIGLNPDDLKNLSPEERMAKVKEASTKKQAELEKKKADGTITAEEKETLTKIENMKKMREGGGFSPEQNEKMLKELGLNPDDLKNLSREEKWAKIKEASNKKQAELEKKQTDGTITADEKELLQRMEERKKRFQERGGDAGSHRGGKPGAEKK